MDALNSSVSYDYNGVGALDHFAFDRIGEYLAQTVLTPILFLFVPGASDVIFCHTPAVSPYLNLILLAFCGIMLLPRAKALPAASKGMLLLLILLLVPAMNFVQFIAQGLASGLTIYAYVFFDVAVLLLAASALNAAEPLLPPRPHAERSCCCASSSRKTPFFPISWRSSGMSNGPRRFPR